ncbi:MAG: DUF6510 family protein [Actinomycetes bacterium]
MSANTHLDGNAAAGPLHTFFAVDLMAAVGQCDGCGQSGRLAEATAYVQAPGVVVRCRSCEGVLLRVVEAPGRAWLDMRGLRNLQLTIN